jgi:hypothetical protein
MLTPPRHLIPPPVYPGVRVSPFISLICISYCFFLDWSLFGILAISLSTSLLFLLHQHRWHCCERCKQEVHNVDMMLIRYRTTSQCQRCKRCKEEDRVTKSKRCWFDIVQHRDVDDANKFTISTRCWFDIVQHCDFDDIDKTSTVEHMEPNSSKDRAWHEGGNSSF